MKKPQNRFSRKWIGYHRELGSWGIPHVSKLQEAHSPIGRYRIRTNSIGLRDDREFTPEKDKKRRLLFFGDSFTHGAGIDVEKRFTNLIEERNDESEIINFAFPGTGADLQYLTYSYFANTYDHDVVFFCPHVSNITRCTEFQLIIDENADYVLKKKPFFELIDGNLKLLNSPTPIGRTKSGNNWELYMKDHNLAGNVKNKLRKAILESRLRYPLSSIFNFNSYPQFNSDQSQEWLLTKKIVENWISENSPKPFVIVPLPSFYLVFNHRKSKNFLKRFFSFHDPQNKVYVIDVMRHFHQLSFFQKEKCFLSFKDRHFSPFGHKVMAYAISQELKSNIFKIE